MDAAKKQLKIENSQLKTENETPVVDDLAVLPTETEIYILPDGTVMVADMPIELASLLGELGEVAPCEVAG